MNKKQTAVDFLVAELIKYQIIEKDGPFTAPIIERAKALESQQMIEFFVIGCNDTYGYNMPSDNINYDKKQAEKYYNEKYGD